MAINFPPLNTSDPDPVNGEVFTDIVTKTSWRYDTATNAWTSIGAGSSNLIYRGGLNFTVDYATNNINPVSGDIYSNNTAGTADADFTGIVGDPVAVGELFLYDGKNWNSLDLQASPFTRNTSTGVISPVIAGSDLDMLSNGSYIINSLSDLNDL